MIRNLLIAFALIAWSPLALADFDTFRCMARYQEPEGEADVIFYGNEVENSNPTLKMEFLGDNGFFGEFEPIVDVYKHVEYQSLDIESHYLNDSETTLIVFRTQYNPVKGNYEGTVEASTRERSYTTAVRCAYLKVI